jgi:hypothetical protein
MALRFSRWAGRVVGPLIIVLETLRRWRQFGDPGAWPAIADDYIAGAFLFWAAASPRAAAVRGGRLYLAAAWGVLGGMAYGSFFTQLHRAGEPDPSGLPVLAVLLVKGFGLLLSIAGLIGALRAEPGERGPGAGAP